MKKFTFANRLTDFEESLNEEFAVITAQWNSAQYSEKFKKRLHNKSK